MGGGDGGSGGGPGRFQLAGGSSPPPEEAPGPHRRRPLRRTPGTPLFFDFFSSGSSGCSVDSPGAGGLWLRGGGLESGRNGGASISFGTGTPGGPSDSGTAAPEHSDRTCTTGTRNSGVAVVWKDASTTSRK
jgi:hypothetical protein